MDEGVGGILGLLRAQVLVRSQGVAIAELRQGRSALCPDQVSHPRFYPQAVLQYQDNATRF